MKNRLFLLLVVFFPFAIYAHIKVETFYGIEYTMDEATRTAEVSGSNPSELAGDLIIPSVIDFDGRGREFYTVTSIGKDAFLCCQKIVSVTIPNSVTNIGIRAFGGCDKLKSVIIPQSVITIADFAFDISGLITVTIPQSVVSFGNGVFRGCTNLTSIVVEEGNPIYDSRDGCNAIIETKTNVLLAGCINTIIPNDVIRIDDNVFSGFFNLKAITIPSSITTIGECAFDGCLGLLDVYCPGETVPVCASSSFDRAIIQNTILHVNRLAIGEYKITEPWCYFKEIVPYDDGAESGDKEQCSKPSISFEDGKLLFSSETTGGVFHYNIKDDDIKSGSGNEVELTAAYKILVYTSKEGYYDSEVKTAMLYWVNVDPISTGLIENELKVNTNAILVQNNTNSISISGVGNGTDVMVYNISGQLIGQAKATNNRVEIGIGLSDGDVCIIKIGDKSLKYLLR